MTHWLYVTPWLLLSACAANVSERGAVTAAPELAPLRCPLVPALGGWVVGDQRAWTLERALGDDAGDPAPVGIVVAFFSPACSTCDPVLWALREVAPELQRSHVSVVLVAVPPLDPRLEDYGRELRLPIVEDKFGQAWRRWRLLAGDAPAEPPLVVVVNDVHQRVEVLGGAPDLPERLLRAGAELSTACRYAP